MCLFFWHRGVTSVSNCSCPFLPICPAAKKSGCTVVTVLFWLTLASFIRLSSLSAKATGRSHGQYLQTGNEQSAKENKRNVRQLICGCWPSGGFRSIMLLNFVPRCLADLHRCWKIRKSSLITFPANADDFTNSHSLLVCNYCWDTLLQNSGIE